MATIKQVLEVFLRQNLKPRALPYGTRSGSLEVREGPHGMYQLWFKRGRGYHDSGPKLLAVRYGCMVNVGRQYYRLPTARSLNDAALGVVRPSIRASAMWADLQPDWMPSQFIRWGGWYTPDPPAAGTIPVPEEATTFTVTQTETGRVIYQSEQADESTDF